MNRLRGRLPKVGIRPTIDGRRMGIRESLEEQTMKMAENVAQFLTDNLRHSSGEKLEVVISNTTIGGVSEAAKCEQQFRDENVGVSLTVSPCWCYGSETIDQTPGIPKAIWGFNGTERPGAVYLAAAVAGHNQLGDPVFSIYGSDVQDAGDEVIPKDVQNKLLNFVKAGLAVSTMKGKSYLGIGSVSMGIIGSYVDMGFFKDYLGMRTEFVDMVEIRRRLDEKIYDEEEYKKALEWTQINCKDGKDTNPEKIRRTKQQKEKDWEVVVKMTIIMRDLMIGNPRLAELGFGEEAEGHNAIAAGFQGQRHWTDHMPNGDFSEAILNSSFDWNGIRQTFIMATENDSLNGVSMLFGHLLTDTAQIFSDVRTFWSPESVERVTGKKLTGKAAEFGMIHLINSGSTTLDGTGEMLNGDKRLMKPFWDITEEDKQRCLDNTSWCPASVEYFRGGGYSSLFKTKGEMPITMSRVNIIKGLGPVTWPTTWFVPRTTGEGVFKDVYSVMNNWGANHGAISYGHIGDRLITLASMLRIPVSMHNIEDDRVFF